jgi:tRNA nucleotidyltransferase (CCA-adding enzyme)
LINKNLIPKEALMTLNNLQINGYCSYLVGGCVRDLLLNKQPKDYDICTIAKPEKVKSIFNKVIDTGIKYGTVTVLINNIPIEVTTYRTDGDYSDGRRPNKVEFGTDVVLDVSRRDFTINGLLYDGNNVIDHVEGLKDLIHKNIQAIGSPNYRFIEDALRMIRAIRFACQLNFNIEQETFKAISCHAPLILNVSWERIRDELIKILISNNPSKGIRLLQKTNLLRYILPELQDCYGFDQHNHHHHKDAFEHILKVVDSVPNNITIRLAALLHDIAKPKTFSIGEDGIGHFYSHHIEGAEMSKVILNRLKLDNKTIDDVFILIREHMSRYPKLRNASVKKLINRVGKDNVENLINLQIADIIGSNPPYDFTNVLEMKKEINRVLNEKEPISLKDVAINGDDLIELGMNPGPEMGNLLKKLLEIILINPNLNTKEELLEAAVKMRSARAGKHDTL